MQSSVPIFATRCSTEHNGGSHTRSYGAMLVKWGGGLSTTKVMIKMTTMASVEFAKRHEQWCFWGLWSSICMYAPASDNYAKGYLVCIGYILRCLQSWGEKIQKKETSQNLQCHKHEQWCFWGLWSSICLYTSASGDCTCTKGTWCALPRPICVLRCLQSWGEKIQNHPKTRKPPKT